MARKAYCCPIRESVRKNPYAQLCNELERGIDQKHAVLFYQASVESVDATEENTRFTKYEEKPTIARGAAQGPSRKAFLLPLARHDSGDYPSRRR
jgi:hypothetical protein